MTREAVKWFSEVMEAQLKKNDFKGGWQRADLNYLFSRLIEECAEVSEAIRDGTSDEAIIECADVANMAMMIADNLRRMYGQTDKILLH